MPNQIQLKNNNNVNCYPNPYWPVGSIFLSMNNTNPSTYFGGTWKLIGQGRTLVGVKKSDSVLNGPNKTGGSTNPLTKHIHMGLYDNSTGEQRNQSWGTGTTHTSLIGGMGTTKWQGPFRTGYAGNNNNHVNWQPFITCYIWNRTA